MSKTEAIIANNALVLALNDRAGSRVWRKDVSFLASSTFALRGDKPPVALVLRCAAGDEEVAAYDDKEKAVQALNAVTRALFTAAQAESVTPSAARGFFGRFIRAVFYVAIVLVVLGIVTMFFHSVPVQKRQANQTSMPGNSMPVPADEMLK